MTDLRLGRWQDVLADVECDALIVDPPYGERTHKGHNAGVEHTMKGNDGRAYRCEKSRRTKLNYGSWTPDDVRTFVDHWAPRTTGWICAFSCSDLFSTWREAMHDVGRCTFAPIACVIRGMSVRLNGDGPANWVVYLNVARPRTAHWRKWGALPGAYPTCRDPGYVGGKPIALMNAIVRDYSRPGDRVCDPCAGAATTAVAAEGLGRRFVGAEVDPDTHAKAMRRLTAGVQKELFA